MSRALRGFTLVEVLVALVIVAFGMGAVLSALSGAANNITIRRSKTLAQWIALNQVAETRLALRAPSNGTVEGDVADYGGSRWHWRQDVAAMNIVPGLQRIVVRVQRSGPSTTASSNSNNTPRATSVVSSSASGGGSDGGNWLVTVVGFRGDALAAANGEVPDWTGSALGSSSGGGSSGGATLQTPTTGTTALHGGSGGGE